MAAPHYWRQISPSRYLAPGLKPGGGVSDADGEGAAGQTHEETLCDEVLPVLGSERETVGGWIATNSIWMKKYNAGRRTCR